MTIRDARGVPVSAATPADLARYETALQQFQTYVGDPVATIDSALAESPDFVLGHVFKALALFTAGEKQFVPMAEASLAEATRREGAANDRERALIGAARRFLDGLTVELGHFGLGTIGEIFDGDEPYTPRGCIAQAWSVAETLRGWVRTAGGG